MIKNRVDMYLQRVDASSHVERRAGQPTAAVGLAAAMQLGVLCRARHWEDEVEMMKRALAAKPSSNGSRPCVTPTDPMDMSPHVLSSEDPFKDSLVAAWELGLYLRKIDVIHTMCEAIDLIQGL
ncbi:hypothetical protein KEM52_005860, partial [Ascosphaera acerosa]